MPVAPVEAWHLESRLDDATSSEALRYISALHWLFEDSDDQGLGTARHVLGSGSLGQEVVPMRLEASPCTFRRTLSIVGPWPRAGWALSRCHFGPQLRHGFADELLEWRDRSWRPVGESGPKWAQMHLVPWGASGAMAVAEIDFYEDDDSDSDGHDSDGDGHDQDSDDDRHEEHSDAGLTCRPRRGQVSLGTSAVAFPQVPHGACDFNTLAMAATPAQDLFVAGSSVSIDTSGKGPSWSEGPLEILRWKAGATIPERDDLRAAHGDLRPAWSTNDAEPLLAVSATEAYFAVDVPVVDRKVAILRFDGRSWSEVLRASFPFVALERAPDGAIWVIADDEIYRQRPSAASPGFDRIPAHTVLSDNRHQEVSPFAILPLDADHASVMALWYRNIAVFTVTAPATAP